MLIQDNGAGFDTQAKPRGNGLKNLRRRAEKLKGTLKILSQTGDAHGTTVSFTTRLSR
jgi:signal transduction histidine kinase